MHVKKVIMAVLGLCRETVVRGWHLHDGDRPRVEMWLRRRVRRRGRCGRCGGGPRSMTRAVVSPPRRHVDVGFATCELVAGRPAGRPRPSSARRSPRCRGHGATRRSLERSRILAVPDRSARSRTDGLRTRGPSYVVDTLSGRLVSRRGRGSRVAVATSVERSESTAWSSPAVKVCFRPAFTTRPVAWNVVPTAGAR